MRSRLFAQRRILWGSHFALRGGRASPCYANLFLWVQRFGLTLAGRMPLQLRTPALTKTVELGATVILDGSDRLTIAPLLLNCSTTGRLQIYLPEAQLRSLTLIQVRLRLLRTSLAHTRCSSW